MAEPISIIASCVGIASGITSLLRSITTFIGDVRDARKDLRAVKRELESLQGSLTALSDKNQFLQVENMKPLRDNVLGVVENCGKVVAEMRRLVLDMSRGSIRWATSGKASMAKLQTSLEAHKSALEIALELITISMTASIQQDTKNIKEDTGNIQAGTEKMLEEIRILQTQVASLDIQSDSKLVMQKFLVESVAFAESAATSQPSPKVRGDGGKQSTKDSQQKASETKTAASKMPVRTWTDRSTIFSVEAEFISLGDGEVTLRKTDGTRIVVAIDKMSTEDLKYLAGITEQPRRAETPSMSSIRRSTRPAETAFSNPKPPSKTFDWGHFLYLCGVPSEYRNRCVQRFIENSLDEDILPNADAELWRSLGLMEKDVTNVMRYLDSKYRGKEPQINGQRKTTVNDFSYVTSNDLHTMSGAINDDSAPHPKPRTEEGNPFRSYTHSRRPSQTPPETYIRYAPPLRRTWTDLEGVSVSTEPDCRSEDEENYSFPSTPHRLSRGRSRSAPFLRRRASQIWEDGGRESLHDEFGRRRERLDGRGPREWYGNHDSGDPFLSSRSRSRSRARARSRGRSYDRSRSLSVVTITRSISRGRGCGGEGKARSRSRISISITRSRSRHGEHEQIWVVDDHLDGSESGVFEGYGGVSGRRVVVDDGRRARYYDEGRIRYRARRDLGDGWEERGGGGGFWR